MRIDPLSDQQSGFAIMMASGIIYVVATVATAGRALAKSDPGPSWRPTPRYQCGGRERGSDRMNPRWRELIAIPLVGDGVVGIVIPARHVRRWLVGPAWWRDAMRPFVRHPQLTRWVGVAEAAVGLWLAVRENHRQSG